MPHTFVEQPDALDDAIRLEGRFEVNWIVQSQEATEAELLHMNERNLLVLNAIEVMNMHRRSSEGDDNDALRIDVQRVEAKVDLLLDLVNQIFKQQYAKTRQLELVLTATSLRWTKGDIDAKVGDHALVDLYIHPSVSMPIRLALECVEDSMGRFYGLSPTLQNALDKLLFRQHRRAIAVNKQARSE